MEKLDTEAKEKGFYDVEENDSWKPCVFCGGELVQERKAFFKCINCGQGYIADAKDMRI